MANSPSGESVINRVIRLLAAFRDESPAMSLRQLARMAELPISTAHRLAAELEVEGLLVRDDAGKLRHGYRLWEIASRGSRASSLREAALPYMEELVNQTGNDVSLGVIEGVDVLYLERLTVDDSSKNITKIAGRLPIHGCSAGLIYMAFAPEAERERFLSRRLEKLTPDTVVDPVELRALLARAKERGFVSVGGIIVPEASGVSVPVFGADGQVLAMLTLILDRGEENLAANLPQLTFASRAISLRLGFEPERKGIRRKSAPAS